MNNREKIKFTKSQDETLDKINEFRKLKISNDLNTRVFVLKGKAGTGKSTIIKYALSDLLEHDKDVVDDGEFDIFSTPKVIGVCMSHKAKSVLKKSIRISKTFASYFGLKIEYLDDGSQIFVRPKYGHKSKMLPCDLPLDVVVHDECSMYDQKMVDIVFKYTNPVTKIIFMGDPGQLPPVDNSMPDADSPTFSLNLSNNNTHLLTERVRQTEGNPIIALSDIIYNEIFRSQNLQVVLNAFRKPNIKNGIGYESVPYRDFLKDFKNSSDNYMDVKTIAYRNAKVNTFNNALRSYIHNKPDKMYIAGEIIYMNDSYMHQPKGEKNKRPKWVCYNSDEYLITNVAEETIDKVHCYILFVDKKGHHHLQDIQTPYVRVVSEKGMAEYNRVKYWRSSNAKKAYGKERGKLWKYYYDFISKFGNVSYGYTFTGYKAQGSGYKQVYVDVNDIVTCKPISQKRKLQALYTAITRATHKVTFLTAR